MSAGTVLLGVYDDRLVCLSAFISILASYAALDISERIGTARGGARLAWLFCGAMAMGSGIWVTHYVGLLAFHLPLSVPYDWPTLLVALLLAIVASGIALDIAGRSGLTAVRGATGSVFLGAAIAGMDYIGVAAMRLPAACVYSPWIVFLSAALAIGVSFVALKLAFAGSEATSPWARRKLASAAILGLAIPIVHFVGIEASTFYADPSLRPNLAHAVTISPFGLTTISLISLVILVLVCAISSIDRHLAQNQRRLLQSQLRFHTVFDNLAEGIAVLDLAGNILLINETAERITGLKQGQLPTRLIDEAAEVFTPAGDLISLEDRPARMALRGQFVRNHQAALHLKGSTETIWVEISTAPVPNPDGGTAQVIVSYRDITERKRVGETQARLAAIVESSEDAIIGIDGYGLVTSWNIGAEKIFNFAPAEIVGHSITKLIPPDREGEEDRILAGIAQGRMVDHFETVRCRKDGQRIYVSLTISPIRDAMGKVVGASKIARDITERKQAEESLREQAQLLHASQMIARDVDGRIVFWPGGAEKMYGFTSQEAVGAISHELLQTQFPEPLEKIEEQLLANGRWEGELVHTRRDGETLVASTAWILHRDREGRPARVLESLVDVTEKRRAEEKARLQSLELALQAEELARSRKSLEEKTLMLQSVLDSMCDGLVTADEQGHFVLWNAAAERILGLGPVEKSCEEWSDHYGLFRDDGITPLPSEQNPLTIALRGEVNSAVVFIRNQNKREGIFIEVYGTPLIDRNGAIRGGVSAFRDITQRKQAEEAARQFEQRFAKAFKSSPIPILISVFEQGRVLDANDAMCTMLGYEMPEMVGRTVEELGIWARPEEREKMVDVIRQEGRVRNLETQLRTKAGQKRDVILSIEMITVDGADCLLASIFDVTETRNLERQLAQSHKMEALGQLTGGIAHDFNNLLGVVVGNLDLLERQVAWNETAVKRAQTALRAAGRGAELTRRLLAFSRREQLNPAPVVIDSAIRETVELARRTLGPEIRISTRCDEGLPPALVDAAGLETALLNLALNARDAMPKGGALTISAHIADLTGTNALVKAGEVAQGKYARIAVSDSGTGMSRETLDRAFEPFFTTKARDKGTGLGLAMVYGFIKQSGGAIRLYSEVGYGTTVSIYLPLAAGPAVEETVIVPARAEERLGGTALVVDDEPDLLDVADAYLAELGYTVIRAQDAAAALAALDRVDEIDLLITDIIMPGQLNGIELADRVRKLRPQIRIIFTSGFPAEALAERSGRLENGPLLHKPYLRAEFADMVRKSMSATPARALESSNAASQV
jgi:PAS domain S-box-containing protein